ncbi:Endonuclease V [Thermodesulfobium narugense DSM 14796]|uniref:Endonuclease V n=1 Tax=Thermodesulfobium narugense DSM 14796 TaxID=747365 RepID=M1E7G8_9BACT|nr:endonuclease V [Thermodesulfobium narugense]AEE15266.1 Endonuclease V [Thermodesulfobium narugense DSM 14796]
MEKYEFFYQEAIKLELMSVSEAKEFQNNLRNMLNFCNFDVSNDIKILGLDVSYKNNLAKASAVVFSLKYKEVLQTSISRCAVRFPYIPGFLAFREVKPLIAALRDITVDFDVVMVDGQGIAHPRRAGLACHIGYILKKPTFGCAKSRLFGKELGELGPKKGSFARLVDKNETIGVVLRTQDNVSPVYVSVGNMINLTNAIEITLKCSFSRIPEPLKIADKLSKIMAEA